MCFIAYIMYFTDRKFKLRQKHFMSFIPVIICYFNMLI